MHIELTLLLFEAVQGLTRVAVHHPQGADVAFSCPAGEECQGSEKVQAEAAGGSQCSPPCTPALLTLTQPFPAGEI